jgi:replicative DNA helicase
MRDIKNQADQWCQEGWVPDVVVIDYADILAPMHSTDEGREQINKTWKAMRALSQSGHALVATATQSSAKGYSANILTRKEFSDDKRKMAHVTAMIGINISEEEKENGLMRLNYIVLRDDEFVSTKCIHVASAIDLMNPAVKSIF